MNYDDLKNLQKLCKEQAPIIKHLYQHIACLEATLKLTTHPEPHIDNLNQHIKDLPAAPTGNTTNSSMPPSSDGPAARAQRRLLNKALKAASDRKHGTQPKHKFHQCQILPLDQVHHVIATRPEQYAGYRATLNGNDHNPLRHKVFEISPIKPVVTEFQPYVLREFVSMSQNANKTVWLYGYILLNTGRLLMRQWKRYKGGDLSRERLKEVAQGKRRLIEANLKVVGEEAAKEGGVVRKLLKHFESLWVFVEQEVVELTNTVMERALRHAVIWRKTRFGSESELGLRFTEGALAYLELLNGRRIPSPPTSKTCSQVHPNPSSLLPYSRECLRGMYENHPGTGQYLRTQQHEEVAVNHGVQA